MSLFESLRQLVKRLEAISDPDTYRGYMMTDILTNIREKVMVSAISRSPQLEISIFPQYYVPRDRTVKICSYTHSIDETDMNTGARVNFKIAVPPSVCDICEQSSYSKEFLDYFTAEPPERAFKVLNGRDVAAIVIVVEKELDQVADWALGTVTWRSTSQLYCVFAWEGIRKIHRQCPAPTLLRIPLRHYTPNTLLEQINDWIRHSLFYWPYLVGCYGGHAGEMKLLELRGRIKTLHEAAEENLEELYEIIKAEKKIQMKALLLKVFLDRVPIADIPFWTHTISSDLSAITQLASGRLDVWTYVVVDHISEFLCETLDLNAESSAIIEKMNLYDDITRILALKILERLGDTRILEYLLLLVRSRSEMQRFVACDILAKLGQGHLAFDELMSIVQSRWGRDSLSSIRALLKMNSSKLNDLYKVVPNLPKSKRIAFAIYAAFDWPRSKPLLDKLAKDRSAKVRKLADRCIECCREFDPAK